MALILSLETSASSCSVALHENGTLLRSLEISQSQAHAEKLAVLISEVLKEQNILPAALNAVAVSSGPGSYTGLRIGASTAKGLCFGLNIPLIAVPTLQFLAYQVANTHKLQNSLLCSMIDARRLEVYCEVYDLSLAIIQPVHARIIDGNSFGELLDTKEMLFFGDGAEKCKPVIKHRNARFLDNIYPTASPLGSMAYLKFQNNEIEDLVNFTPFYLKDFVAKKAASVF
jgi:tRNA threonylcarbamoyladenosine biosynthesis protein TsaB